MAVRNLSDIAAIEAVPLIERNLPQSTYAALVASAKRTPDAKALTFLPSADHLDETHVWSYGELVADVTRAANLFAALGVAIVPLRSSCPIFRKPTLQSGEAKPPARRWRSTQCSSRGKSQICCARPGLPSSSRSRRP
jgi:hypothetical protein